MGEDAAVAVALRSLRGGWYGLYGVYTVGTVFTLWVGAGQRNSGLRERGKPRCGSVPQKAQTDRLKAQMVYRKFLEVACGSPSTGFSSREYWFLFDRTRCGMCT